MAGTAAGSGGASESEGPVVGICCSGGGIRAASYALGCLQVLDEKGVLRGRPGDGKLRAKYLSAVSGGSYAAGAVALMQESIENRQKHQERCLEQIGPFAQDSPEFRYLRNHLSYLTRGSPGLIAELWQAAMGLAMNFLLFVSLAAVFGYIGGWLYGAALPQLRHNCGRADLAKCNTAVSAADWTLIVTGILGGVCLLAGLIWVLRRWTKKKQQVLADTTLAFLFAALIWALLVLALPQVLAWLHHALLLKQNHVAGAAPAASTGISNGTIATGGLAAFVAALAATIGPAVRLLYPKGAQDAAAGWIRRILARYRGPLLNLLALLAVPGLFGALLLLFLHNGSDRPLFVSGTSFWQVLWVAVPSAAIAAIAVWGDLNVWSLHTIYKRRLEQGFSLERAVPGEEQTREEEGRKKKQDTGTAHETGSEQRSADVDYREEGRSPTGANTTSCTDNDPWSDDVDGVVAQQRQTPVPLAKLSHLTSFPQLRICATTNVTAYGVAPTGSGALPFVFAPDEIGGPNVGVLDTAAYARWGFRERVGFSVMDAISISGAAVSPEMGRMTRAPLRLLLALANIRLGVWIPKPKSVAARPDFNPRTLASRALPWLWNAIRRTASKFALRYRDDEARQARLKAERERSRKQQEARRDERENALRDEPGLVRAMPGPGLVKLLREGLGQIRETSRFSYVTDGGHFDNLGLVELLHPSRRCRWIWCIDASGDSISTFSTLGNALAIAASTYNVTVNIHPDRDMAPQTVDSRFVVRPFCQGTVTYLDSGFETTLVVVKAGVPKNAPWNILAFQDANKRFPCDPTANQLFTAARFDAYVALGRFSMEAAYDEHRYAYERVWGIHSTPGVTEEVRRVWDRPTAQGR